MFKVCDISGLFTQICIFLHLSTVVIYNGYTVFENSKAIYCFVLLYKNNNCSFVHHDLLPDV